MREAGARRRGPNNPRFKAEKIYTRYGQARAYVTVDEETRLSLGIKSSRIARARFVWMQAHPNEPITRWTPIHHINGDTLDDRPENLEKMPSPKAHMRHHAEDDPAWGATTERAPDKPCAGCEKPIRPWRKWCSTECMNAHRKGAAHANTGRDWPAEMRAKIAASLTGKKASEETRAKQREAHLKRWAERKADPNYQPQPRTRPGRW